MPDNDLKHSNPKKNQSVILIVVLVTTLLDAMSIGLIIPVTPDLIMSVAPELNFADAATLSGLLISLFALMQLFFGPFFGTLSDQVGRRRIFLFLLVTIIIYHLIFALGQSLWLLFLGRLIGGVGAATNPISAAILTDVSAPKERAVKFGYLGAAFGLGFVVGPVVGGFLGEFGTRAPFWVATFLAGINLVLGWFYLPETLSRKNRRDFKWQRANPIGAIYRVSVFSNLRFILVVFLLYQFSTAVYPAIWSFYTLERFSWSTGMIGASLTLYGMSLVCVQGGLVKPIISKLGESGAVKLGFIFAVVVLVSIGLVSNENTLLFLIPFAALGAVGETALKAIASQSVEEDSQGVLQGALSSLTAISMIITPSVMSSIFTQFIKPESIVYLPGAPFILSAILLFCALLIFIRISSGKRGCPNS
jgi:DHA1 family tetracycline resistance protein-like MFS transporter